jgi:hypothetical protein
MTLAGYTRLWVTRPEQAARFTVYWVAKPSVNVMLSMTNGNWFAPFRRRHFFATVRHRTVRK